MLGSPGHLTGLLDELGSRNLADGAELGGRVALMNVTAYRTYPFFHLNFLLSKI
jgi:hypothetical protein